MQWFATVQQMFIVRVQIYVLFHTEFNLELNELSPTIPEKNI